MILEVNEVFNDGLYQTHFYTLDDVKVTISKQDENAFDVTIVGFVPRAQIGLFEINIKGYTREQIKNLESIFDWKNLAIVVLREKDNLILLRVPGVKPLEFIETLDLITFENGDSYHTVWRPRIALKQI